MRVRTLELENFMAFQSVRLDFTKLPNLVLIEGPNGAGKSTILEALVWGLFGRCLRYKGRSPDVRNSRTQEPARVTVELEEVDGSRIIVTRRRTGRGNNLDVSFPGGKEAQSGLTTGMQEVLENRLQMDFELFRRSVVFGGEVSRFCQMGDAERKEMLEEMVGVAHYIKASEEAKKRRKVIDDTLSIRRNALSSLLSSLEDRKAILAEMEEKRLRLRRERDQIVRREIEIIHGLRDRINEITPKIFRASNAIFHNEEEYIAKVREWEERVKSEKEKLEAAREKARTSSVNRGIKSKEIAALERELEELESEEHPEVCPTCLRSWPQCNKSLADMKGVKTKALVAAKKERAELRSREERDEAEVDRREESYAKAHAGKPERSSGVLELQSLSTDAERLWMRHDNATARIAEAKRAWREVADRSGIKEAKAKVAALGAQAKEERRAIRELETEIERLSFWVQGFSRNGIPNSLLQSSVPFLNESVQQYLNVLTNGRASVNFQVGDGSLGVEVEYADGGATYDSTSKGEHTRVDVAVLFAIRSLMDSRIPQAWSQVFLDEVCDGLDEEGTEAVSAMLRVELADKGKQVVIISHDTDLKNVADATLSARKGEGGWSVLTGV